MLVDKIVKNFNGGWYEKMYCGNCGKQVRKERICKHCECEFTGFVTKRDVSTDKHNSNKRPIHIGDY
jgi:predicted amidophosphoribosyltransferase